MVMCQGDTENGVYETLSFPAFDSNKNDKII